MAPVKANKERNIGVLCTRFDQPVEVFSACHERLLDNHRDATMQRLDGEVGVVMMVSCQKPCGSAAILWIGGW